MAVFITILLIVAAAVASVLIITRKKSTPVVPTPVPKPTPPVKPPGSPPLFPKFISPQPTDAAGYLAWLKANSPAWYAWLNVNPADIPNPFVG